MSMNNKTNFSNTIAGANEHTENSLRSCLMTGEEYENSTVHSLSIREVLDLCHVISGYITGEYSDDQFDYEILKVLPSNLYHDVAVQADIWNIFKDCLEYRNRMSKFFNELPLICELGTEIECGDNDDIRYNIREWNIGHWGKSYFHQEAYLLGWSKNNNPIVRYKGTKYEAFNIKECQKNPESPYYNQAVKVMGIYDYPKSQPARDLYETEPMFLVKTDEEPITNC